MGPGGRYHPGKRRKGTRDQKAAGAVPPGAVGSDCLRGRQQRHGNAASRRDGCGNGECLGTAESGGRRSVRRRRTGWDLSLLSGAGSAVGDGFGRCSGQICANRSSSTASARFGGNGQLWAAGSDCAGALVSNQKVLPSPTWLCTPKRKPWLCRIALVIDSPSPVPTLPASLRLR